MQYVLYVTRAHQLGHLIKITDGRGTKALHITEIPWEGKSLVYLPPSTSKSPPLPPPSPPAKLPVDWVDSFPSYFTWYGAQVTKGRGCAMKTSSYVYKVLATDNPREYFAMTWMRPARRHCSSSWAPRPSWGPSSQTWTPAPTPAHPPPGTKDLP